MTTLGDFPDRREVPEVDPSTCHPRLAGKPHAHQLCEEWQHQIDEMDRRRAAVGVTEKRSA